MIPCCGPTPPQFANPTTPRAIRARRAFWAGELAQAREALDVATARLERAGRALLSVRDDEAAALAAQDDGADVASKTAPTWRQEAD
jgi:hypothetical protein